MWTIITGGYHTLSWQFITSAPKDGMTNGGIFPAIIGTFLLVLIMSIAGVPIGTITAIYLCEYAKPNSVISRLIRFAVNTLAGVRLLCLGYLDLDFLFSS